MSEKSSDEKEKKKLINFKFGIRKDLFKALIMMAIMMGLMIFGMMIPGFGMNNGMAFGMAIMGVLMTLSNDMTREIVKNTLILLCSNVGMTIMAFLAYGIFPEQTVGRLVMMSVVTLVTFFLAIYLFTSEEKSSTYMPLLLGFSLMIYYNSNTTNVSKSSFSQTAQNIYIELLIRMAIYAGAALLAMALNFLIHKKKFSKKIISSLEEGIKSLKEQIKNIYENKKDKKELLIQSAVIEKTFTSVEGAMGTKLSVQNKYQRGHDFIRTISILKRVNKSVTETFVKNGEKMDKSLYDSLESMILAIYDFENDKISQQELEQKFDTLYHYLNPNLSHSKILDDVKSQMDDFVEGEVYHLDNSEQESSVKSWFNEHINIYNFIFASKIALLAALGVFFVNLINLIFTTDLQNPVLPMGYMVPLYIGITAQPYLELNKGGVKKRIINTIYAVALILISFSITQNMFVHFAILIALTLIGDMFFQFDFMTMMGTMVAIVMNVVMQPDKLYSYSFYRLGYIGIVCVLVQVVDMFIFPNTIPKTIQKQLRQSLLVNDKLRAVLADDNSDYETLHQVLMEKRKSCQKLRATNRFAQSENITAFLLADEEWLNRLTMINYRLKQKNEKLADLKAFVEKNSNSEIELTFRQKNILQGFNETLEDIKNAEKLALAH